MPATTTGRPRPLSHPCPSPDDRPRPPSGPRISGRHLARAGVALGVPALAILGAIPVLDRSHAMLWGMPVLLDWIFLWMPGTSLCLWLAWRLFDRGGDDALDDAPGERT